MRLAEKRYDEPENEMRYGTKRERKKRDETK